jgi:hypothetical protein
MPRFSCIGCISCIPALLHSCIPALFAFSLSLTPNYQLTRKKCKFA